MEASSLTPEGRWRGKPVVACALRALVLVLPLAASIAAVAVATQLVPTPSSRLEQILWWVLLVSVATVVMGATDKAARRVLPLAALLELTMVFPDQAPSRMKTAIRAGSTRNLERKLAEARAMSADDDTTRAAELILELVAALNVHDRATRGHSERVKVITEMLADELGIEGEDREKLRWAALLHDVGKLTIPYEVLNKPGKLDAYEMALIQRHPTEGERLCRPLLDWLGPWGAAIGDHQEKYDGTGYPAGKAGEEISWAGRVVAVADVFEVITAARSYKRPLPAAVARKELADQAGRHFDPVVVRAFLSISLGRLRLAMGPLSWLAQVPFLGNIGIAAAPAAGTLASSVAGVAALTVSGLVSVPAPVAAAVEPVPAPPARHAAGEATDLDGTEPIVAFEPEEPSTPAAGSTPTTTTAADDAVLAHGGTGTNADPFDDGDGDEPAQPATSAPRPAPAAPAPGLAPPPVTAAPSPTPAPLPPVTQPPATLPPVTVPPTTLPPTTLPVATTTTTLATVTTTTILVPVANVAPVAASDLRNTPEDTAITIAVLANDRDADGDPLSVTGVGAAGHGTVGHDATTVTYTPDAHWYGVDAFSYTVSDGKSTATGSVQVTVAPVPDAPIASTDVYSVQQDSALSAAAPGVLGNDHDPDGDPLSVNPTPVDGVDHGSLVLRASGAFTYTPAAGWTGVDRFTYQVSDGLRSSTAVVSIQVEPPAGLSGRYWLGAAGASADRWDLAGSAPAGASTEPDWDGDGDPGLTIEQSSGSVDEDEAKQYQEWALAAGTDLVLDGNVTVTLTSTNKGFKGGDARIYLYLLECDASYESCATLASRSEYRDPWSGGAWQQMAFDLGPIDRTVASNRTLLLRVLFVHDHQWIALGGDRAGWLQLPLNNPPTGNDDTGSTTMGSPVDIAVILNDTDYDGDPITVSSVGAPDFGSASDQGGGIVRFTPPPGWTGVATFTYTVADDAGMTDSATVTVTVGP